MSLRDKILQNNDEKKFELTSYEFSYLKDMNNVLLFHTLRSNLISGFLTYIATTRLGFTTIPEGYALQYEVDLKSDTNKELIVRTVPKPAEDVISDEELAA
jgi:hypothetical protein